MNLGIFFEVTADGDSVWWQSLASGLGWTLSTALFAGLIAFFLGSVLGVARTTSRPWLVRLGNAYVELFRNIPLIVQFFLWYFVIPGLMPAVKRWVTTLDPTEHQFVTAVVCLGLFTASRISEQVRSGIQSLPRGQRAAGYAVGLTEPQTYRYVLLPMAYRIIIPPLTSEFLNIFKNSSVASLIGLMELMAQTKQSAEFSANLFEAFTLATLIYFTLNMSLMLLMRVIERRVAVPGLLAAGGK